jgi:hypothetical protein
MLTQTTGGTQLLAFTHRLIALDFHADVTTYRALCDAYTRLLDAQAVDEVMLTRLFDTPCLTAETLLGAIEALIASHSQEGQ